MSDLGPHDLQLTRLIDAPASIVWKALTTPEILKTWWAPAPVRTVEVEMDLRPGGVMRTLMIGPKGEHYPSFGIFLEIVPGERMIWTDALHPGWRPAQQPFMTGVYALSAENGKTRLTVTALHKNAEDVAAHKSMGFETGVGAMLEQFATAVEAMKAGTSEAESVVEITRFIPASRAKVWRAFTDPAHLPKWWGPNGFSCETKELDLRVGGQWRFDMIGPDAKRWPNRVKFLSQQPMDQIDYEIDDDGLGVSPAFHSSTFLSDEGDGTRVTMRLRFASPEIASQMRVFVKQANGASTLEKLERHVAAME